MHVEFTYQISNICLKFGHFLWKLIFGCDTHLTQIVDRDPWPVMWTKLSSPVIIVILIILLIIVITMAITIIFNCIVL